MRDCRTARDSFTGEAVETSLIVCETDGVQVLFADHGSKYLMITFAPMSMLADGSRFFADGVARRGRISTLGFVAKRENCFPEADIRAAMPAVEPILELYGEKVSMGHSMGGYAVIKYASLLRTDIAVAMSPQYSINPDDVPEEFRWFPQHFRADLHRDMRITGASAHGRMYVLFDDKHQIDRFHVGYIEQNLTVTKISIPYSEHDTCLCFTTAESVKRLFDLCRIDDRAALQRFALQRRKANRVRALGLGLALAERHPRWAKALLDRHGGSLDRPHFVRLGNRIARAAIRKHQAGLAIATLLEVLARDPGDAGAHSGMADAYALRNELPEAIESARKLMLLEPGKAEWPPKLASLLLRAGNPDAALATLESALRLHPAHPVLLFLRGEVAQRQGELAHAIDWVRRAASADPTALFASQRLGELLLQAGDLGAAAERFRHVLNADPRAHAALGGLVDVHLMAGRLPEAIEVQRELVTFRSGDRAAGERLDELLRRANAAAVRQERARPSLPVPDLAAPDLAAPDLAAPDLAVPDLAVDHDRRAGALIDRFVAALPLD